MDGLKNCPNCGARNPSTNRFCEDCGYDMNKASASSSAPASALFCPNGHTVSEYGLSMGFCDVCAEKLVTEKPVIKPVEPEQVKPLIPTPTQGKKCPRCGTINPKSNVYCEECSQALVEAPLPSTPEKLTVMPPSHPSRDPLPDIPDIMRPMTNDDMKR